MNFSEKFCGNSPFKNVEKPAKTEIKTEKPKETPMSESELKLMHATQSKTDKAIREQEYPGKVGVIIGEGAPEMSPLEAGGYEGAADVVGAATYIPTAHMYTDMFNKIGQAAMDIESNIKNKGIKEQQQKDLAAVEAGTMTQDMYDLKYPKAKTQKYKENKDGTFSLIT